jgi:hypothetical protein
VDISYLSQARKVLPWFAFACVLEALFWMHLAVRVLAVGVRRFASFYENQGDSLLNLLSLIALVELGKQYCSAHYDYSHSLAMGWYLLFQALRLFKVFFAVNDVRVFEHMRPVLIRASFVYFSIIYFFSIFGYSYFCHAMDPVDALNTSTSNDASQWVQYQNLLNFNTLLQSVFTLFQLGILGNWSIVMDAAVASTTQPASAYIFFYTYRLVITLFVLPILLSFIIQVFLSALNICEREVRQEKVTQNEDFTAGMEGRFTESNRSKVSYNVNQEVLTMGRPYPGPDASQFHTDDDDENSDSSDRGTTLSPLTAVGQELSTLPPKDMAGSSPAGRSRMSIRMGDTASAQYARRQHTETVAGVAGGSRDRSASPVRATQESLGPGSPARQESAGKASTQHQQQVTVQYDVRAGSSMMSIWTIDGNGPSATTPSHDGVNKTAGPKSGHTSASHKSTAASTAATVAALAEADRRVLELQARLDAALKQLDAERFKTKALQDQAHLI